MIRKLISTLLVLLLAGCGTTAPEQPSAESGTHGCDAFEVCGDEDGQGSEAALSFKESYEVLNGTENSFGKIHRTVSVPDDHPFEKTDPKDVVKAIEDGETFWVYFGDYNQVMNCCILFIFMCTEYTTTPLNKLARITGTCTENSQFTSWYIDAFIQTLHRG